MSDIPINIIEQLKESANKKRQLCNLIWHITIVTNKKFTGTESHLKDAEDKLLRAVEETLENKKNLEYLLPLRPKAVQEGNKYNSGFFKEIDVEIGEPELGPDSHVLHVHLILTVRHYTLVGLNTKFLQKSVGDKLGMGVYVNMRLIPASVANVREYIYKSSGKN